MKHDEIIQALRKIDHKLYIGDVESAHFLLVELINKLSQSS